MSLTCPTSPALVEAEIDRIATQYRESPLLIFLMRTYLAQVAEAIVATCAIPSFFDIETAVGDQLTLIGKRLGFPRCHCVCAVQPVFGFECESGVADVPVGGFCDDNITWRDCGIGGIAEICIAEDEMYRGFLLARRYQALALYDVVSLTAALRHVWGATASVIGGKPGRVIMTPGRALTNAETAVLQLVPRVLPVAPGIVQRFHLGPYDFPVFGFGEGWGGFCEPAYPDGVAITLADGTPMTLVDGTPFWTAALTEGAPWACQVDIRPYECPA